MPKETAHRQAAPLPRAASSQQLADGAEVPVPIPDAGAADPASSSEAPAPAAGDTAADPSAARPRGARNKAPLSGAAATEE